jgi:hypothetical protein
MFCPHCGAPTKDEDAFCQSCGAVLPGARGYSVGPARPSGVMGLIGEPGIRLMAYAVVGLVAMLLIGEVLRFVVALLLPVLVVAVILYWARSRRRRYYHRS